MIHRTCTVFLIFLVAVASCSDDILIGDLPQAYIDEFVQILQGTLTLLNPCSSPIFQQADFLLYTRSNPNNTIILNASNPAQVDPSKKVVLLIHGYMSSPTQFGMPDLKNAYLARYDCNVIAVDWSPLAWQLYTTAYCGLPGIAEIVTNFLCTLSAQLSIPLLSVQLVGHSMGAQMSGLIGKYTTATCQQEVGTIAGLDPAGPLFQDTPEDRRLCATDAQFVQIIHTNEIQSGYRGNCGDVDFHVNCGYVQPGCPTINILNIADSPISVFACSHLKSIYYWAESVLTDQFKAQSCGSCPLLCKGDSIGVSYTTMGEDCPRNPPKKIYKIPTNASPPYAKGCAAYSSPSGCS